MRRLCLLSLVGLLSCAPAKTTPPASRSGSTDITAAELARHVEYLASDELMGRETLTDGAHAAADYIAKEMKAYGLSPLPGRDDLKVPYELLQVGFDEDATKMEVELGESRTARPGKDFTLFSFSDAGSVEAPIVFAGYGITAPEAEYDDYAGLNVKGKIVLVLRHVPNENDDSSQLVGSEHAFFRTKAVTAQEHGARAMLLVTDPLNHQAPDDLRLRSSLFLPSARERVEGMLNSAHDDKNAFLSIHVSRELADEIARQSGKSLAELQTAVDAGTPASKLALKGAKARITIAADDEPHTVHATDVVGFIEGTDPVRKKDWIVVGAHYDHLGGYDAKSSDAIYNGADDNASGTAGLLELAQYFAAHPTKRSMVFAAFSGEEKGLLGSYALLEQKIVDADRIVFMQNYDMIGRNPDRPVVVYGDGYATKIREVTERANEEVRLNLTFAGSDYSGNSDHHPFFESDIPVMFFFTGLHDDYHQLTDHADKIGSQRMEKIVRVGAGILDEVASGRVTPQFIHQIAWLGAEIRVRTTNVGSAAVITAIDERGRGAKAGLKKGDVIVEIAGDKLENAKDVGRMLRGIDPGTETSIVASAGGARRTVKVKRAKTGFLGVMLGALPEEKRKEMGLREGVGLLISGTVPEGPAEKAGVKTGDVLIELDGIPVGPSTLRRELARIGAGEPTPIVVVREGQQVSLKLTLGERPETP